MCKQIFFLSLIVLFISCNKTSNDANEKMKETKWLIGNWEQQTTEGLLIENWSETNDSTFTGQSLFIKGKDTIHHESIVLQQTGENIKYTTIIKGQNSNEPIEFKLNKSIDGALLFENPTNDYPQKLKYKLLPNKQCQIEISGLDFEEIKTEKYTLKKVQKQ